MKKFVFITLLSIFLIFSAYSGGTQEIQIDYPLAKSTEEISIHFTSRSNIYQIEVLTKEMDEHTKSEIEKVVLIDKEYFDSIYEKLLNLNFKEIVKNSENIAGADGTQVSISIGTFQNGVVLNVWSPDYDSEERKTGDVHAILQEVFAKLGLEEWLE